MRTLCWLSLVGASSLALMSCSNAGPSVPQTQEVAQSPLTTAIDSSGLVTANAGEYTIHVDLQTGKTSVTPRQTRAASAIGDLYFLKVNQFGLVLSDVSLINYNPGPPDTIELSYSIGHSFPAPSNPAGPATAANRADLGVSGRVCFLVDAPAARVADDTSALYQYDYEFGFQTSNEVMNPKVILNADGFYNPKGMLSTTPANGTTAYPFKALVDESLDPRTSTFDGSPWTNGGDSHGNYGVSNNWSASAQLTPNQINYTGYGVLHQGQKASNSILVNVTPGAEDITLDTAIIANYTDPRGGANAAAKRANRLPSNDPTKFAYRMPHGAVDFEDIFVPNSPLPLGAGSGSQEVVQIICIDQDFSAIVGTGLGEIPNPSGVDLIELSAGELSGQVIPNAASGSGAGSYEAPVIFPNVQITNSIGGNGGVDSGAYVCVKIVDEQDSATAGFEQGLTLNNASPPVPVAAGSEQHPIVFQVFYQQIA
ncbi:MAG: hypothetical protein ABI743_05935 [bacterium]